MVPPPQPRERLGGRGVGAAASTPDQDNRARYANVCSMVGSQREFQRAQFLRAIEARKVYSAWELAMEMRQLSRADALALVLLLAEEKDARFDRTSGRWGQKWIADHGGHSAEDRLVLAALGALVGPTPAAGVEALREVCEHHGEEEAATLLETCRLGRTDTSDD